jgi:DNA-binding NarL/FixJ family response regulator
MLTVFIVDDSPPVAEMLAELAAGSGAVEVVGVGDSEHAALDGIRRLRPDVVVLDLQLHAGSGANVIRAVRSDPALDAVRLLVTSNHAAAQMRAGCLALGADGYFDKVKELEALGAKLAELASARR